MTLPTVEILAPDILNNAVIVPNDAIVASSKLPVGSIDAYVVAPAVI